MRRAVTIADGDYSVLFGSWLTLALWAVAIIGFVLPIFVGGVVKARMRGAAEREASITD